MATKEVGEEMSEWKCDILGEMCFIYGLLENINL
jgi:hypothetical protein